MEIKNKELFKKIVKYSGLAIFGFVVLVIILFTTNIGIKYFFGSLSNGVPINTPAITNQYAYGETVGWIDFNPTGGNVQVGDNGLAGYAYGENIGWISLGSSGPDYLNTSETNYGVNNDGTGNLSGYAFSETAGWIDFGSATISGRVFGVSIDTSGNFSGYAYGENVGWISFNCSNTNTCADDEGYDYKVQTDWRATNTGEGATCVTDENCDFRLECIASVCTVGGAGNTIVNGACGSASGTSSASAPSNNLCSAGMATTVAGNGPWTWSCEGLNGGTIDSSCRGTVFSGGGMPAQPQATSLTPQEKIATMNYISAQLEKIRLIISILVSGNNQLMLKSPTSTPPTELQPTTPPTNQEPAENNANRGEKISILQRILNALDNLINLIK